MRASNDVGCVLSIGFISVELDLYLTTRPHFENDVQKEMTILKKVAKDRKRVRSIIWLRLNPFSLFANQSSSEFFDRVWYHRLLASAVLFLSVSKQFAMNIDSSHAVGDNR